LDGGKPFRLDGSGGERSGERLREALAISATG
jgi:hypothetical protein